MQDSAPVLLACSVAKVRVRRIHLAAWPEVAEAT